MKHDCLCCVAVCFVIIFFEFFFMPLFVHGAFLYKNYIVRQDRGQDILCDPYVVQKNDYVLKLFRQKGEIAHEDFPKFLSIFKRINPHIRDINRIRPNQYVFIPLKKLKPGTMSGQSSGIVTIPFVTISNMDEILTSYSSEYKVQAGDCVSIIIAHRYGAYGTKSYKEGIKLFELFNPHVSDLNRIYKDQTIRIPARSLKNQPWYQSLFDNWDNIRSDTDLRGLIEPKAIEQEVHSPKEDNRNISVPPFSSNIAGTPFSKAASALDATLLNKGAYYFPRKGEKDFALDLSRFPVLKFKEKSAILSPGDDHIPKTGLNVIRSSWNNVNVISIPSDPSMDQVIDAVLGKGENASETASGENIIAFSDHGVKIKVQAKWVTEKPSMIKETASRICITPIDNRKERTPDSIRNYLWHHNIIVKEVIRGNNKATKDESKTVKNDYTAKDVIFIDTSDPRLFINDFFTAMGCKYTQNVSIMFPYAGIQVKAVSNLISTDEEKELLVDFGNLYGDAIECIEKTGFKVIQIKEKDNLHAMIERLLKAGGISHTKDPTFLAAKRPVKYNTALTIPGFLVGGKAKSEILFASVPLHDRIVQFLQERDVKIIRIGTGGR